MDRQHELSQQASLSARQILADVGFLHWSVFIAINGMCWFIIFSQFFTFCLESGTAPQDASVLIALQGAANTAGRLGLAVAVDRLRIPKVAMLQVCVALMGVATALLAPLGGSYAYQAIYMVLSGVLGGSVVSMQAPISCDLIGLASLPLAQGIFHLAQAPFVLVGPPIASAVRSATGSFDAVWLMTGFLICSSALICSGAHPGGWRGWWAALRSTCGGAASARRFVEVTAQ